ncbi:MAG: bifunctional phosphoserine phosphatase/homoserine phosphotransferase ThrH, partial [Parcubacteria group bacterium]|nr:bifunctional phosphoserine phosphatase/homoserine phosphotransferase ThrH [Parcubacteria group bacterium]
MRTKKPLITALDLEGTLVPEMWVSVAEKTGIKKLRLTTRDIPDYDALMKMRLAVLRDHGLGLRDIQKIIRAMRPYSGARSFLWWLKKRSEVVILSDTFYEFAAPVMECLGKPMLFCNSLEVNAKGIVTGYYIRQKDGKRNAVRAFQKLGFRVIAIGDSFNDVGMLAEADDGAFLHAPRTITKKFPSIPSLKNYRAA